MTCLLPSISGQLLKTGIRSERVPKKRVVIVVVLFCFFLDGVSLCNSPSCPETHSVDQAGLKLTEIHLPLPPECWDERCASPSPGEKHVFYSQWKYLSLHFKSSKQLVKIQQSRGMQYSCAHPVLTYTVYDSIFITSFTGIMYISAQMQTKFHS